MTTKKRPTRGHWLPLPIEDGQRSPTLLEGDECLLRLPNGETVRATWERGMGGSHGWYDEDGDPVTDVDALWIGPIPERGSGAPTEDYYRSRGKEQLRARISAGYTARLDALAEASDRTRGQELEALIDAEEARRRVG